MSDAQAGILPSLATGDRIVLLRDVLVTGVGEAHRILEGTAGIVVATSGLFVVGLFCGRRVRIPVSIVRSGKVEA